MTTANQKKYVQRCPRECSLNPETMTSGQTDALLLLRETGAGMVVWRRNAADILGRDVSPASASRHLRHYKEADDTPRNSTSKEARPSDVEILDELIVAGWHNSQNWKPSIRDTLEAMKLKSAMTGNSAFQNMLDAMEAGMRLAEGSDEDGPMPENPHALGTEDERGETED